MNKSVLNDIELICPNCRTATTDGVKHSRLLLSEISHEEGNQIIEGFLACSNPECSKRYPIIDGIPIILNNLAQWWKAEASSIVEALRTTNNIEAYFGALNTDDHSRFERDRLLGCYLDAHYGEFQEGYKPEEAWQDHRPYWQAVSEASKPRNRDRRRRALDLGCSTGRHTFELAKNSELTIGLDLNLDHLRKADRFQRTGTVRYKRVTGGTRFEEIETNYKPTENAFFIMGDALNPPFKMESFDHVSALNMLDSVKVPLILLGQINALIRHGGTLLLGSPYEWKQEISEPAEWLESPTTGAREILRNILESRVFQTMGLSYRIDLDMDVNWPLRNHQRYWSVYKVNLISAVKK